jgi:hypothetical protein
MSELIHEEAEVIYDVSDSELDAIYGGQTVVQSNNANVSINVTSTVTQSNNSSIAPPAAAAA